MTDSVKACVGEHLANLKEKGSILKMLLRVLGPNSPPKAMFVTVFAIVFATSALVTFLIPKTYSSMVRIKVNRDIYDGGPISQAPYDPYFIQTEFEGIQSEPILDGVIERLGLNTIWADRFKVQGKLKTADTRRILKRRIELRLTRGTSLIEIRAYSEKPDEAALLANSIAEVYAAHLNSPSKAAIVTIMDRAEPNARATRPNVPLNLFLGGVGGVLSASTARAVAVGILLFRKRRLVAQPG